MGKSSFKLITQLCAVFLLGAIAVYFEGYLFLLVAAACMLFFSIGRKKTAEIAKFSWIAMSLFVGALLLTVLLNRYWLLDSLMVGGNTAGLWEKFFNGFGNFLFGKPPSNEFEYIPIISDTIMH
ncbi:hypothetical protein JXM67_15140 [candidate division WOR-3 bacterium]|nr:hypothetical protein [candidate division WOR-3 bacterium]